MNSGLPNRVLTNLMLILGCTFALFKHLLAVKQKQVILSSGSNCRMHKMYSKGGKEVLFRFVLFCFSKDIVNTCLNVQQF